MIQLAIIFYVIIYALWLQGGYQEYATIESSITVKIKGVTKSYLDEHSSENKGKVVLLVKHSLKQIKTLSMLAKPLAQRYFNYGAH